MQSVPLDMDDLFDRDDDVDSNPRGGYEEDDDGPREPFRDEGSGDEAVTQNDGQDGDGDVTSKLRKMTSAKKRTVKPQPKLDPDRLRSTRGLPALPKIFENFQFKGKGREAEDLTRIMKKLEHWAHRLYPKLPFDDFIDRLETLGKKRQTQVTIKRIRNDMPVNDEDFMDGPADRDDVIRQGDASPNDMDAEAAFDRMLAEEQDAAVAMENASRNNEDDEAASKDPDNPSILATPVPRRPPVFTSTPGLSAEQQERIERNRRLALERRKSKMADKEPCATINEQQSVTMETNDAEDDAATGIAGKEADEELNEDEVLAALDMDNDVETAPRDQSDDLDGEDDVTRDKQQQTNLLEEADAAQNNVSAIGEDFPADNAAKDSPMDTMATTENSGSESRRNASSSQDDFDLRLESSDDPDKSTASG